MTGRRQGGRTAAASDVAPSGRVAATKVAGAPAKGRRRPPAVVLVRPQEEGNVGAAARAMANMGLAELILVEPAVPLGDIARARAVGAQHVLDRCRRAESLPAALVRFRRAVGTTSARGRVGLRPLPPRDLATALADDPPGTPTALVFGPEASGLTSDELALTGPVVRIPAASRQPTLNLAQAVLVVAYELRAARLPKRRGAGEPPATAAEIEGLFAHLTPLLREVGFGRDDTFEGVLRDLRRLTARAAPTSREVTILRGICRRVARAVGRRERR